MTSILPYILFLILLIAAIISFSIFYLWERPRDFFNLLYEAYGVSEAVINISVYTISQTLLVALLLLIFYVPDLFFSKFKVRLLEWVPININSNEVDILFDQNNNQSKLVLKNLREIDLIESFLKHLLIVENNIINVSIGTWTNQYNRLTFHNVYYSEHNRAHLKQYNQILLLAANEKIKKELILNRSLWRKLYWEQKICIKVKSENIIYL